MVEKKATPSRRAAKPKDEPPEEPKVQEEPKEEAPSQPGLNAASFQASHPHQAVLFAGLLASEPDLLSQELPDEEWQRKLVGYMNSEPDRP